MKHCLAGFPATQAIRPNKPFCLVPRALDAITKRLLNAVLALYNGPKG